MSLRDKLTRPGRATQLQGLFVFRRRHNHHLLVDGCHVLGHAVLQLLHVADELAAVLLHGRAHRRKLNNTSIAEGCSCQAQVHHHSVSPRPCSPYTRDMPAQQHSTAAMTAFVLSYSNNHAYLQGFGNLELV